MARQQKSGHQLNSLAAILGGILPRHGSYLRPVHLTEKKVYSTTYADPPKVEPHARQRFVQQGARIIFNQNYQ